MAPPTGDASVITAMPHYQSSALDGEGCRRTGGVEAKSSRGIPSRIAAGELASLTRQLAALLKAGLPLPRSLEVFCRQSGRKPEVAILETVAEHVRAGGRFSDALSRHPGVFDHIYVNMVRAGEATGRLGEVLDGLAQFLEKAEQTRNKVRSAMVYPLVVLTLAALIVMGLMFFVIPVFEEIFEELMNGAPLPAPTRAVVGLSSLVATRWALLIPGLAGVAAGVVIFRKSRTGGRILSKLSLRMPGVSSLIVKASSARFCRTLGTLMGHGVPILESLQISGQTVSNRCYREAARRLEEGVRDGERLSVLMNRDPLYPVLVTGMVEVGEETGDLTEMLNRIADNYDDEVDHAVAGITSLIEPLMILLLAMVIGFIVVALFLPVIEIMQSGFAG